MSKDKGFGWATFKKEERSLWDIHDSLVEQERHYEAHCVVVAIAISETHLVYPNFMHRSIYRATPGFNEACGKG